MPVERRVYPSGFSLITNSRDFLPPVPTMFSMTMGTPKYFCRKGCTVRASTSLEVPAAWVITSLTGFEGNLSAPLAGSARATTTVKTADSPMNMALRPSFVLFLPFFIKTPPLLRNFQRPGRCPKTKGHLRLARARHSCLREGGPPAFVNPPINQFNIGIDDGKEAHGQKNFSDPCSV